MRQGHRQSLGSIHLLALLGWTVLAIVGGCDNGGQQFITVGTAPAGGAFAPVGNAIANVVSNPPGSRQGRCSSIGQKSVASYPTA